MKNLTIIDIKKEYEYQFTFNVEDDNGVMFTVQIEKEDIEYVLGVEHGFINLISPDDIDDDVIINTAQDILDGYLNRDADYEVDIKQQEVKAYSFKRSNGGTHKVCASMVLNPFKFQKENNYISYNTILG